MRVKLDENLPKRLCAVLQAGGHQPDTVQDEGLTGRADAEVWQAAQDSGALFITQDLDFSDLRRFLPGSHCGIVLVRLKEPGRDALYQRLRLVVETEDIEGWQGCHVVVSDRKTRVRRPGPQGGSQSHPG